ncbi:MAG: glutaminyl-peptide cyclotransferase [Cytophagales bacterium]|nr:glutaminyl-peptide cyclotransferase [Cytophagales bacterium]
MKQLTFLVLCSIVFAACENNKQPAERPNTNEVPIINYAHVAEYPHDRTAFTEGLLFHQGQLFESTGASNVPGTRSLFGEFNLATGEIAIKVELDATSYFGEGITFLKDRVYQLTYTSRKGFVYDATTFQLIQEFTIPSKEGWGMTTDGQSLIMSDGTNQLTYLGPDDLQVSKKIKVIEGHYARDDLNELEYVDGYIYANVFTTNEIVKIDPKNGQVVGKLDLTSYTADAKNTFNGSLEMNGIAYHPDRKSFFFTGKMWPKVYEIRLGK